MRRTPAAVDLTVYVKAIPVLLRNPAIIVVPLLMAIVGVLLGMVLSGSGGGGAIGYASSGLGGLIVRLLQLFGLGAACIIADDAWRHGRASFDRGWSEARRRGGDLLMAGIGITLILAVALVAGGLFSAFVVFGFPIVPLILGLLALLVLIWALPAAAVGGIPGGAAIQDSIDRVRANPVPAVLTLIVAGLALFGTWIAAGSISAWAAPFIGSAIVFVLIDALMQAIAFGYIALIITKTYTDTAFGTRRW